MEEIKINIEKIEKNIQNKEQNILKTKEEIEKTKNELEKIKKTNFIIRFLTRRNPQKLEKLLNELSLLEMREKSELSELQKQLKFQIENLQNMEKDRNKLMEELKFKKTDFQMKNILKKEFEKQKTVIEKIKQEIKNIENTIHQLSHIIIRDAKLIGTTITKAYLNKDIYSKNFEIVVVDEASIASPPALFFTCGLAHSKVIIIGDFRQLGPIARAENELVGKWLKRDIFEISGIAQKVNKGEKDERLAPLYIQRRMPKEIAELVNNLIYEGILKTEKKSFTEDKKEKQVIQSEPFPNEKIILCDTSQFNPWCSKTGDGSRFNIYNAFLCIYLAEQALLSGVNNIAILSPYKAQNKLIHKLVAEKKLNGVISSTIHRFQGKESDLVIFDLVEGKWLDGGFNTEAMRLINVAITRAKAKIIFVANLKYFKKNLEENSILKKILEDVEKNYHVISTLNFFPFPKKTRIDLPLANNFTNITFFSEKRNFIKLENNFPIFCDELDFYPLFKNDLLQTKDEVLIVSPFITPNRITYFEPIFRELYKKGVKTFIITKPFKEQKISKELGREITNNLKNLNIELRYKPRCHEKLAVIDRKIIWHGSLNILSHQKSKELMMRFTTGESKFVEELLKLLDIHQDAERRAIEEQIEELNKKGIGYCPAGQPLIIKLTPSKIILSCNKFPHCQEKFSPPLDLIKDIIKKLFEEKYLYCEKCGSPMEIKFNKKIKSYFLGCSKFPNCLFTRKTSLTYLCGS